MSAVNFVHSPSQAPTLTASLFRVGLTIWARNRTLRLNCDAYHSFIINSTRKKVTMLEATRRVALNDFRHLRTGLSQEKNRSLDFKAAMVVGWASLALPRLVKSLRPISR